MNEIIAVKEFVMTYLDPLGVVVSLVLAIPIIWTWYSLTIGKKRRLRKIAKLARQSDGKNKTILILSLLPSKNIRTDVERFLDSEEYFNDVIKERIMVIERNEVLQPDNMPEIVKELQNVLEDISAIRTDELYVFMGAPGCVPALLGAELANSNFRVYLMQNVRGEYKYVNYGPLRYPRYH